MNYRKIRELNSKLFFKIEDVARLLSIEPSSSKVLCSRYAKQGLFLRLKKNHYILIEKWERLNIKEYFKIANFLQVPSYISLMSALTFYELSSQIQRNFIESICSRRTKVYDVQDFLFQYHKLRKELYFGFQNIDGVFIAEKEKAFLDCVYLSSFGKYKFDIASIDLRKLDFKKVKKMLSSYPDKTGDRVKELCRI